MKRFLLTLSLCSLVAAVVSCEYYSPDIRFEQTITNDYTEIVKALQEVGFDGYVRPDHGRMIWSEVARPGYGLYDRALGVSYLNGLWEAVEKSRKDK